MDAPGYANDFVEKINRYIQNGFFPGEDVYFTYESSENPLETGIIKKIAVQIINGGQDIPVLEKGY